MPTPTPTAPPPAAPPRPITEPVFIEPAPPPPPPPPPPGPTFPKRCPKVAEARGKSIALKDRAAKLERILTSRPTDGSEHAAAILDGMSVDFSVTDIPAVTRELAAVKEAARLQDKVVQDLIDGRNVECSGALKGRYEQLVRDVDKAMGALLAAQQAEGEFRQQFAAGGIASPMAFGYVDGPLKPPARDEYRLKAERYIKGIVFDS